MRGKPRDSEALVLSALRTSGDIPEHWPRRPRARRSYPIASATVVRGHVGYGVLGAIVLVALMVFVIAIGAPLWLEVLSLAAASAVWLRYRWKYTGWRERHHATVARRSAEILAKRERKARKRRRP